MKMQQMTIDIWVRGDLDEAEFTRTSNAVLLRMVSAQIEKRPVDRYFDLADVTVRVSRPLHAEDVPAAELSPGT